MRAVFVAMIALFCAACAEGASVHGGVMRVPLPQDHPGGWPFPQAPRGSAMAPPSANASASTQAAPPEGVSPGGMDFGHWRAADPATYSPSFQAQVRQRFAGRDAAAMRADLIQNGFACEEEPSLQCRIEIMEHQCDYNWYVVLEQGRAAPIAGFEQMCLGARSSR